MDWWRQSIKLQGFQLTPKRNLNTAQHVDNEAIYSIAVSTARAGTGANEIIVQFTQRLGNIFTQKHHLAERLLKPLNCPNTAIISHCAYCRPPVRFAVLVLFTD